VGQITDYDKLTLEVWTNGVLCAQEAVSLGARVLTEHLNLFVEMSGDALDGRPILVDQALWSSDASDADLLGTVTDVRTVLVSGENGENTLNLYLTVEAKAHYREGKGYRMGATMLLAGMKGTFMAQGLVAEGTVTSMHEKSDEPADTAGSDGAWADWEGTDVLAINP